MDHHEAVHKMVEAYRTQMLAINYCDNSAGRILMSQVRDIIFEVGEKKFGREFISTLHSSQVD